MLDRDNPVMSMTCFNRKNFIREPRFHGGSDNGSGKCS
jgi:hypothetical protein